MGMSRSGTTLVARLLSQLGLFLGRDLLADHEARYFYTVNKILLERIHASWDQPAAMRAFLQTEDAVNLTVRCLEEDISSYQIARYLGVGTYLKCRSLKRYDHPWGWKDPANVFTLPLWLRIFSKAKLLYIVRNGVDVANSLVIRERKLLSKRELKFHRRLHRASPRMRLQRAGFKGSVRCLSLQGSFSLWEEYVAQAEQTLEMIHNDRRLVKFEEFLADPRGYLLDLVRFCELEERSGAKIDEIAKKVDNSRANAFVSDPVLKSFHSSVNKSRWMIHYGYSGPPASSS
jgi:hypothetical protein